MKGLLLSCFPYVCYVYGSGVGEVGDAVCGQPALLQWMPSLFCFLYSLLRRGLSPTSQPTLSLEGLVLASVTLQGKLSGYWSHASKAISLTHPSTESSTQAEASINFVKIDFIIIKCHFKQMPHHPTALETRVGMGVQSNISHHSKGKTCKETRPDKG